MRKFYTPVWIKVLRNSCSLSSGYHSYNNLLIVIMLVISAKTLVTDLKVPSPNVQTPVMYWTLILNLVLDLPVTQNNYPSTNIKQLRQSGFKIIHYICVFELCTLVKNPKYFPTSRYRWLKCPNFRSKCSISSPCIDLSVWHGEDLHKNLASSVGSKQSGCSEWSSITLARQETDLLGKLSFTKRDNQKSRGDPGGKKQKEGKKWNNNESTVPVFMSCTERFKNLCLLILRKMALLRPISGQNK